MFFDENIEFNMVRICFGLLEVFISNKLFLKINLVSFWKILVYVDKVLFCDICLRNNIVFFSFLMMFVNLV